MVILALMSSLLSQENASDTQMIFGKSWQRKYQCTVKWHKDVVQIVVKKEKLLIPFALAAIVSATLSDQLQAQENNQEVPDLVKETLEVQKAEDSELVSLRSHSTLDEAYKSTEPKSLSSEATNAYKWVPKNVSQDPLVASIKRKKKPQTLQQAYKIHHRTRQVWVPKELLQAQARLRSFWIPKLATSWQPQSPKRISPRCIHSLCQQQSMLIWLPKVSLQAQGECTQPQVLCNLNQMFNHLCQQKGMSGSLISSIDNQSIRSSFT